MKYKNLAKVLLFLLLIYLIGHSLYQGLVYKDMGGGGGWQRFYSADQNSIDVMIYGSSHAHCTVNNAYLWDKFGMASFTLSAGAQKLDSTYYFMKESLKSQKPKVMLVEMLMANDGMTGDVANVYRNFMGMKWSAGYYGVISEIGERNSYEGEFRKELLLKLPIFHSRYKELTKEDFVDDIPYLKGYRGSYDMIPFEVPEACKLTETGELSEDTRNYLEKMTVLSKDNGIQLVFFAAPFILDEEKQRTFNAISVFAEENNIPFINFNSIYEEIDFDYGTDMREETHVNNSGADKITDYLGRMLSEKYSIPNRTGEPGYADWDLNSRYILTTKGNQHRLSSCDNIHEYMQTVLTMYEDYIVILSLDGNYGALGDVYTEDISGLGIGQKSYEEGGVWIIRQRKSEHRVMGKEREKYLISEDLNGKELILTGWTEKDNNGNDIWMTDIVLESEDCKTVENGVNIIVYDPVLHRIVDKAGVNVYEGLNMVHKSGTD